MPGLCNYCGCRSVEAIATLTAQHETITDLAGALRRAVQLDDLQTAERLRQDVVALLRAHTASEERGIFAEMRLDGTFAEAIDGLCAEHTDIHGVIGAEPVDWPAVLEAVEVLWRHIDKEEHGLFPASIGVLDGDQWARVDDVMAGSRVPAPNA